MYYVIVGFSFFSFPHNDWVGVWVISQNPRCPPEFGPKKSFVIPDFDPIETGVEEGIQEMEKAASKGGDHGRRSGGYFANRSHDIITHRFLSEH